MIEKKNVELAMLETTEKVCEDSREVISYYPPLLESMDNISSKLGEIKPLSNQVVGQSDVRGYKT